MQNQYRKMKNLFLRQSYLDAWADYQRSVRKLSFPQWDYIVLTASNEAQAESFRSQIKWRKEKGVLPPYIVKSFFLENQGIFNVSSINISEEGAIGMDISLYLVRK